MGSYIAYEQDTVADFKGGIEPLDADNR